MRTQRIVIVGGGSGGITVAARLLRADRTLGVTVIEPSEKHYYQPAWTLVGAGTFDKAKTERPEASLIPRGAEWLRDSVAEFQPEQNRLTTSSGQSVEYDALVVAAGLQIDWGKIKGLKDAIGHGGVCSNYSIDYVDSTWQAIRGLREGNALFTIPTTVIKCGGAPQKIMYLAEDYFRRQGIRDKCNVILYSAAASIFAVKKYRDALESIIKERGIQTHFKHNLIEVCPETKEAVFENVDTHERVTQTYSMLHITPPMSAPDFIKHSPLAAESGWVDVDQYTLQHHRFPNVFALGDSANLPTSKTGAAIRKQAPVLVANLRSLIANQPLEAKYKGYTSCPIVTSYGQMMLAEFDYELNPQETFPFNQAKGRWSMWILKKYVLPLLYWYGMLRGKA